MNFKQIVCLKIVDNIFVGIMSVSIVFIINRKIIFEVGTAIFSNVDVVTLIMFMTRIKFRISIITIFTLYLLSVSN